ncbi:MAG: hypothetical protein M1825_003118 [Sarcosagium campestre]|nr:MAG: hypothetical protein M1825_003118 [Sarcosagium campestre]
MVVKPCTAAEVAFYESANASHPAFAAYMPTFMGTLTQPSQSAGPPLIGTAAPFVPSTSLATPSAAVIVDDPATSDATPAPLASSSASDLPAEAAAAAGAAPALPTPGIGGDAVHGHKLATDLHIVLSNAAAGFTRPNVLDVKLGARLWDDDTAEEKRARLDKVAAESTSSSLGFRIAGMKVWQGATAAGQPGVDADGYKVYGKMYGRELTKENIVQGFRDFLFVEGANVASELGTAIAIRFRKEVEGIKRVLEAEESRMYGASILFVYEGDGTAARQASETEDTQKMTERQKGVEFVEDDVLGADGQIDDDGDDDGDYDEDGTGAPKICAVKLIDFAHARWVPGEGPDENVLHGVRNVIKTLDELCSRDQERSGEAQQLGEAATREDEALGHDTTDSDPGVTKFPL